MDEEELEQPNKININSFFQSVQSVDRVAKSALNSSETSLKSSRSNLDLIKALQSSFASLRDEVEQITRYILVEQDERSKILNQREQEAARREDDLQKGIFSAEDAREKSLQDDKPFSGKNRFLEGITGGLSNIIEQNQDLIAGAGAATILGAIPFNFGGIVPGSGDADTVNAKLTPGEFVIPKERVEEIGANPLMDFIKGGGLIGALGRKASSLFGGGNKGGEKPVASEGGSDYFLNPEDATNMLDVPTYVRNSDGKFVIKGSEDEGNEELGANPLMDFVKGGGLVGALARKASSLFGGENKKKKGLRDEYGRYTGDNARKKNFQNKMDKYLYDKEMTEGFSTYSDFDDFDDGVGFDELIDDDSTIKSGDRRGLLGAIGGTIDAATGNLTDFDRRGGKPSGLMRGLTGTIDAATGGLTDLDRRGGKPFGLMRGITGSIDAMTGGLTDLDRRGGKPFGLMRGLTGSIDAMTGGLTDLDRRGGKPFGTMRLATGVADAMTGNLFDLDRRGDGKRKKLRDKEMTEGFSTYGDFDDKDMTEGFSTYGDFDDFDDFDDRKLKSKTNQLSMKTTVNPDGSITSKGSGTFIAGELFTPGQPLTEKQKMRIKLGLSMGNTYSEEIMKSYNMEAIKPEKSVEPVLKSGGKEETKDVKPEKTLGERFMNMFRGDEKNKDRVKSSNENFNVSSNEAMRGVSQTITQPPDMGGDETIVLPPTQSGGDGVSMPPAIPPNFAGANTGTTPIGETISNIPYIDVISNQYLSIP